MGEARLSSHSTSNHDHWSIDRLFLYHCLVEPSFLSWKNFGRYLAVNSFTVKEMSLKDDIRQLLRPYYIINLLLSSSFLVFKLVSPICLYVFPPSEEQCELDAVSFNILLVLTALTKVIYFLPEGISNTVLPPCSCCNASS